MPARGRRRPIAAGAERARRPRDRHSRATGGAQFSSPACYLHEFEETAPPAPAHGVTVKRIYDEPLPSDGYRALIDRLWPRGISKQRAALDAWLIELAPSSALRIWYGHDPRRWTEFGRRYRAELRAHESELQDLRQRSARQRVTLLYSSREPRTNHAVVLREVLLRPKRRRRRPA